MNFLDEAELEKRLEWPALIDAIGETVRAGKVVSPERQVYPIELPSGETASLLLMPAWIAGESIGVKAVTFFPGNAAKGKATINASYLLFDGEDGTLKSVSEGDTLTARRTAAASALAARYLVRDDAQRLLVVGTGQLSAAVVEAHAAVRDYSEIMIWGRNPAKASSIACGLEAKGLPVKVAEDLEAACRSASTISCVTSVTTPIIKGEWLGEGTHIDLIGSFRPDMRETDDEVVRRASIFVDTVKGATLAGDLSQPLEAGIIQPDDIKADLAALTRGEHQGRVSSDEVTLFKSAGFALEDLAAARLADEWSGIDQS